MEFALSAPRRNRPLANDFYRASMSSFLVPRESVNPHSGSHGRRCPEVLPSLIERLMAPARLAQPGRNLFQFPDRFGLLSRPNQRDLPLCYEDLCREGARI